MKDPCISTNGHVAGYVTWILLSTNNSLASNLILWKTRSQICRKGGWPLNIFEVRRILIFFFWEVKWRGPPVPCGPPCRRVWMGCGGLCVPALLFFFPRIITVFSLIVQSSIVSWSFYFIEVTFHPQSLPFLFIFSSFLQSVVRECVSWCISTNF